MTEQRHLILTGFMGVGKTTVGQHLAAQCERPFVDLDALINQRTGLSIPALFAEKGEEGFRVIERDILQTVLAETAPTVIATGGGTAIDVVNRQLMSAAGRMVCLDAPFATIWCRLAATERTQRPLLAAAATEHAVHQLWVEREAAYALIPTHIDTTAQSVEAVARSVLDVMHGPEQRLYPIRSRTGGYDVVITRYGWSLLTARLAGLRSSGRVVVISHPRLRRMYERFLEHAITEAGLKPVWCVVPEGEESKSFDVLQTLYGRLAQLQIDRATPIVSFGGGVVGDLSGFVAATYLRGVPWIGMPTTLVAQLDSAIGGKVGINLDEGKNLVGSVYQPQCVICELSLLETLPDQRLREGLVEALKCGLLADRRLYELAGEQHDWGAMFDIVARSIRVKHRYIRYDAQDIKGRRIFLNLGHTVGHALERLGEYRNWSHGEAVGIGLVAAAGLSRRWGYCTERTEELVLQAVERLQRPTRLPVMTPSRWMKLVGSDKKRVGRVIRFVALRRIGRPVVHDVRVRDLAHALTDISYNRY